MGIGEINTNQATVSTVLYPYDWGKARTLSIRSAGEDEESRDFSGTAALRKPPWPLFPKVTRLRTHSVALLGQHRRETLARVDPGTFAGVVTAIRPAEGTWQSPDARRLATA